MHSEQNWSGKKGQLWRMEFSEATLSTANRTVHKARQGVY
jgi:hypothetical protein